METIGSSGIVLGGLLTLIAATVVASLVVWVMWASAVAVVAPVMSVLAAGARRAQRLSWRREVRDSWLDGSEEAPAPVEPDRPPVQGLAVVCSQDARVQLRLVAADVRQPRFEVGGIPPSTGPSEQPAAGPWMGMMHARLAPSGWLELPPNPGGNIVVYVLAGRGTVGSQQLGVDTGQLAVFGPQSTVSITAESAESPLEVLIFGQAASAATPATPVVRDGAAIRRRLLAVRALTEDLPLPEAFPEQVAEQTPEHVPAWIPEQAAEPVLEQAPERAPDQPPVVHHAVPAA